MAKGYWIVSIDVTSPDGYGEYVKVVRPYLARCEAAWMHLVRRIGRFWARDSR